MKKRILHASFISLLIAGIIILLMIIVTIIPGYKLSAHKTENNSIKKLDTDSKLKLLLADTLSQAKKKL